MKGFGVEKWNSPPQMEKLKNGARDERNVIWKGQKMEVVMK